MTFQGSKLRAPLAVLAMVCAAAPTLAHAQTPPSTAVPGPTVADPLADLVEPGAAIRLSDEKRVTRWASANTVSAIRTAPSSAGRKITTLHFVTEDGVREVYVVRDAVVDGGGRQWLHIRIPMRHNGRSGWVPADYMTELHVVRTHLLIDRTRKLATLSKNGKPFWTARVGIGKPSTPTPRGRFWVRERLRGDGGTYGPWAFGTSAYVNVSEWTGVPVVGIHGTNQPNLIPGRPSHGCIRMRNDKIKRLAQIMPIGTPIDIVH